MLFACVEQLAAQPLVAVSLGRKKDIFDKWVVWTLPWLRDSLSRVPGAGDQRRSLVPSAGVSTDSDYWVFPRTLKRINAN